MITDGQVLVAGVTVKQQGRVMRPGMIVEVRAPPTRDGEVPRPTADMPPRAPPPIPVLELSRDLLVVNKPAGWPSAPTKQGSANTVLTTMTEHVGPLWLVHRLDIDTSGVMLLARTREACAHWSAAFAEGRIERHYGALVLGRTTSQRIDAPLSARPDHNGRHRVDDHGRHAVTDVEVVQSNEHASWLRLTPHTGRTHQLRVHLAHIGHPLVGDRRYGVGGAAHLGLHALGLRFGKHAWRAPLPTELVDAARALQLELEAA
jgi:RluA family pseudouridine synthase